MDDRDGSAEWQERLAAAQAVVDEFQEKVAAATTYLLSIGIPVLTMLEMLEEHQARILGGVEQRTQRKMLREHIINFGNVRLAEAEVQRGVTAKPIQLLVTVDENGRTQIGAVAGDRAA